MDNSGIKMSKINLDNKMAKTMEKKNGQLKQDYRYTVMTHTIKG